MLSVSDWPIIMIHPGGLLLVVPHLFAVPVLVLQVGLLKSTELYLDVKNISHGHILSTTGDALSPPPRSEFHFSNPPRPPLLLTIIVGGKVPVDNVLSKHTKDFLTVLNVFRQSVQMST